MNSIGGQPVMLNNRTSLNICVIGSTGGIGSAFVRALAARANVERVFAASRSGANFDHPKVIPLTLDLEKETLIQKSALETSQYGPLDAVLVTTGMLHENGISPEKSIRDLSGEKLERLYKINTIGPALVAKHFLPRLRRDGPVLMAAVSARVGSISDNELGGWYSYRASKAALNMILKTISIEFSRRHKQSIVVGLHPGTVDSDLSKPFQRNVAKKKLFTPEESVQYLLNVLDRLKPADSGYCFDWRGEIVPA